MTDAAYRQFVAKDPAWWNPEDERADRRARVWREATAWLLGHVPEARHGARALDVACGRGRVTRALLAKGYRTTAVDANQAMLEYLGGVDGPLHLRQGDATALPVIGPYAVVSAVLITEHVADVRALCREVARVARDLVLITATNPRSVYAWWTTRANPWLRRTQGTHLRRQYTAAELRHHLAEVGIEVVAAAGFGVVSPLSLWPGWRGTFLGPGLAERLSARLDRRWGLRYGHLLAVVGRRGG